MAVLAHEVSEFVVIASGLRMLPTLALRYGRFGQPAQREDDLARI